MKSFIVDSDFIIRNLKLLYSYADSWLKKQYPTNLECMKGCSYCCNWAIKTSYSEALGLVDFLNTNHNFDSAVFDKNMALLYEKFNNLPPKLSEQSPSSEQEYKNIMRHLDRKVGSCPFLIDDECSAYAMRPLVCRLWVSHSLQGCIEGKIDPSIASQEHKNAYDLLNKELDKLESIIINQLKKNGALSSGPIPILFLGNRIIKCSDAYALSLPGESYVTTGRE